MAFSIDDDDEKTTLDPNRLATPGGTPGIGGTGGAGGLFGTGPGGQGGTPSQAPKANQSGSWTNLQAYLAANQDQAGKMATDVTGNVTQEAQGAQASLTGLQNQFNSDVDAHTVKGNSDLFNQVGADPTSVANDAAKAAEFTKDLNASYQGPTDFTQSQGYGDTVSAYSKAQADLANAGTPAGQQTLLDKQYGGQHEYNQGEKNLDQLLIGGSSEGQKAFNSLRDNWSGLSGDLSQALAQTQPTIQNAIDTTGATAKQAHDTLYGNGADSPGAIKSAQDRIAQEVTDAQSARQAQYDAAMASLKANQLSADQLKAYGLTAGEQIYNLDPSKYLDPSAVGSLDKNQVATSDDLARMNALAKLSGDATLGSYLSPTAMPGSPESFQTDRFHADAAAAQAEYKGALNGLASAQGVNGWTPAMIEAEIANASQHGTTFFNQGSTAAVINGYIAAINATRAKYGLAPATQDRYGGWSFPASGNAVLGSK